MPVGAVGSLAFQQEDDVVLDARVPAVLLDHLRALFDKLMWADDPADRVVNQVNGRRYVTNLDRVMSEVGCASKCAPSCHGHASLIYRHGARSGAHPTH